ncbi:hypothetical protein BDP27DRAFT_1345145 [Rhodocollybia butyracea]|uniref:Uncharacterized protein n=1 Tax=Rhodocollybia butyracea TaxID=206335 RepID=A0A9P5TWP7_9AGAR|nr:hypothetical protein BDP27DRAFT_1345145 [Rhodocollybia butyracea]
MSMMFGIFPVVISLTFTAFKNICVPGPLPKYNLLSDARSGLGSAQNPHAHQRSALYVSGRHYGYLILVTSSQCLARLGGELSLMVIA